MNNVINMFENTKVSDYGPASFDIDQVAPNYCGGSITLVYSIADNCSSDSVTATFSITDEADVVLSAPDDSTTS